MKLQSLSPLLSIFIGLNLTVAANPDPHATTNIDIPVDEYRAWMQENTPVFDSICDELLLFEKARKQDCAILPGHTGGDVKNRNTFAFYISAVTHLMERLEAATLFAHYSPSNRDWLARKPSDAETALAALIRNENDGTWEKAENVTTSVYFLINWLNLSFRTLEEIDTDASEFLNLRAVIDIDEPDTGSRTTSKADVIGHFLSNSRWNRLYPPGTVVLANSDQKRGFIEAFEYIGEKLNRWIHFMRGFIDGAKEDGLANAAYSGVLDSPEYNPRFGMEIDKPYTVIDLFQGIKAWYECWAWPVRGVLGLVETVTPLPRTVEARILEGLGGSGFQWAAAEAA